MPIWLEVKSPSHIDDSLSLDEGKTAAIALAREIHADRLLIDEQEGREIARQLGLHVAGTLAVLRDAAQAGMIDLKTTLDKLRRTSFRAPPYLYDEILEDFERG